MARCSCAGSSCACTIQAGDGLTISGTGNAQSPFVISVTSLIVNTTHSANGPLDLSLVRSGTTVVVALTANVTSMVLPQTAGIRFDLVFVQTTAGHTVAWPAEVDWPGGAAPVISTTVAYSDWFRLLAVSNTAWIGAIEGQAIR